MNIADLVLRFAYLQGNEEALSEFPSDKRRTFVELADRVTRLSAAMKNSLGLVRHDSVAVLSRNRIEYMEVMLACALGGLCVQALNWRLSRVELKEILSSSGVKAIIFDPEYHDAALYLSQEIPLRSCIYWSEGNESSPFEDLIAKQPPVGHGGDHADAAGDDDPFLVVYTGGTTGVSKGAVHTHRTAIAAMANNVVGERIVPTDRFMLMGQMFHSPVLLAINYLTHGCPVVMVNFKPELALQCIEERKITASMGIPTMYQNMLALMADRDWRLGSLRNLQYGGSPTGQSVIRAMYESFGCSLIQCYGRTEELAITFLSQEDHVRAMAGHDVHRLESCGREAWLAKVMLIGPEGEQIPRGSDQAGEIVVRSPGSMIGYLGRPDLTAEATYRPGWLRTGDVARMDRDGYLYVVDRAKELIISGGENIYPAQVERAIQRHDDVLEVAVVGVPDEFWGESVKAYVVRKPGRTVDAKGITEVAAKYLASYQKPKFVEFLDELPKTPAGKIEKRALRLRAPGATGKTAASTI
ncbi:Acyl-CoA synthetase (AMP-forming)/AMP-acid ligase II [Rhizobiales bacterium GAS113]|nr:Acyl-CoA synthetase (AMP-forming)/AMP-acid ligase II [Rhizobiales bacterium GAS113]